ncbi:Hypothetical_protein [Hexamita inflata]|uniref:Hypothetical_protein n=1 Tax=Hexamita inflata TaxID=28002 RepID=A0AA86UKB3_9EUKA|nr:Hypothetical protein HINF_LOCUS46724 [Hexamita inflata]
MAPDKKLVCEQQSLFSQIILVGVFIIQSSLIILVLFFHHWQQKLRVLGDQLVFTMIKLRISFASTPITFRTGLLENKIRSFQLCAVQLFSEVLKSIQIV